MPLAKFIKELETEGKTLFRIREKLYNIEQNRLNKGYIVGVYKGEDHEFQKDGVFDFEDAYIEEKGLCRGNPEEAVFFKIPLQNLDEMLEVIDPREPQRLIVQAHTNEVDALEVSSVSFNITKELIVFIREGLKALKYCSGFEMSKFFGASFHNDNEYVKDFRDSKIVVINAPIPFIRVRCASNYDDNITAWSTSIDVETIEDLFEESLHFPNGSKVFWTDPDEGHSNGEYTVLDNSHCDFALIGGEECSESQVPYHELKRIRC